MESDTEAPPPPSCRRSYYISPSEAHRLFPTLSLAKRDDKRSLKGAIVYFGESSGGQGLSASPSPHGREVGPRVLDGTESCSMGPRMLDAPDARWQFEGTVETAPAHDARRWTV